MNLSTQHSPLRFSSSRISLFNADVEILSPFVTSGGISAPPWVFDNIVQRAVAARTVPDEIVSARIVLPQQQTSDLTVLSSLDGRFRGAVNRDSAHPMHALPSSTLITLDGLSGAGKTTIARALVNSLQISHLESGYVFKAVAKALLLDPSHPPLDQVKSIADKLRSVTLADVADPDLDAPDYARLVPVFSGLPEIQPLFYAIVQRLSRQLGSAVVTGRSVGNHLFGRTDAAVRIFLNVSPKLGAYRKAKQLEVIATPGATERATLRRNNEDICNQVIAVPSGALRIDTDRMTVNEVVSIAETAIRYRTVHSLLKL